MVPASVRVLVGRLGALLGCLLAVASPCASAQTTDEDALKALFLYKFTDYITWPATHAEFRICTAAKDKVTETITEIATQKSVDERPIAIEILEVPEPDAPITDPIRCDLLWVGTAAEVSVAKSVARWARVGTLVVSDKPDAANKGAAIGLITEDERVRFNVDRPALANAELVASAQLLKLARKVQ